jgi:aspartate aminotransferase
MNLSDRIEAVEESRTVRFTPLIQQLRREGKEVINFAVGEPEYDTPTDIISATKKALDEKNTRYGPVSGLPELKQRLAADFEDYDENNIIVSNGSKQALFSVFQVICNPLDEVIIPRPYWVSFSEQVKLSGAKPVFVETIDHQLDCDAIEKAVTRRTKAIVINSPNNPTGAVYPENDLERISALVRNRGLFVVSDEAYDRFIYDNIRFCSMFHFKDIRHQTIVVRSFSKSYNMTGFRIGYIAASKTIISSLSKLQSHLTGNVCTFAQHGAVRALLSGDGQSARHGAEMARKRDIAYNRANQLFDCIKPRGAFYLFPNISKHLRPGESSEEFAARILERTGVAVVPGEAFGAAGHVRISYAVPEDTIHRGFDRMAGAL